jgi:phage terminase large subunit
VEISTDFEYSPKVYDFFEKANMRYRVISGGRGKSATHSFMQRGIEKSFELHNGIGCFTREIKGSLDLSSKEKIESIIRQKGLAPCFEMLDRETRNRVTGTKFIYNGLSSITADTFKGAEEIDFCHLGEAHTIKEKPFQKLKPTIRKPGSEIWVDYNPEEATDAVHNYFTKDPERWPYKPNPKVRRLAYLFLSYKDNSFFPQELEEERLNDLDHYSKQDYLWIWEGKLKSHSERHLINGEWVEAAFKANWKPSPLDRPVYGADIAHMGGDYIVFYERRGNVVCNKFKQRLMKAPETTRALEAFVNFDKTCPIVIDNGHVGAAVADSLEEKGYQVHRINFGSTKKELMHYDPEHSHDITTDMERNLAKRFEKGVSIETDLELKKQLTQRQWDFVKGEQGIIKIESKSEFREHYTGKQKSPDDCDALKLAFYRENYGTAEEPGYVY